MLEPEEDVDGSQLIIITVMCGGNTCIYIEKCVFKTKEFQILYRTLLFVNTHQQISIFYADILPTGDK